MTKYKWAVVIVFTLIIGGSFAQRYGSRSTRVDRRGVPDWQPDPAFEHDVFTFVRIEYDSGSDYWGGGRRGGRVLASVDPVQGDTGDPRGDRSWRLAARIDARRHPASGDRPGELAERAEGALAPQ